MTKTHRTLIVNYLTTGGYNMNTQMQINGVQKKQ